MEDDTMLIVLVAAAALLLLKPSLLSGLFGGSSVGVGPGLGGGAAVGPFIPLQQPPAAHETPEQIYAQEYAQPWVQFDPNAESAAAFARSHPCPPGQSWNHFSGVCQQEIIAGAPGNAPWIGHPPPAQVPPGAPTAPPAAPAAVAEVKAANRRAALFTPYS